MFHHAYIVAGEKEASITLTVEYISKEYALAARANQDLIVRRYGLFSVEDARDIQTLAALSPLQGETKAIILAINRIYHEAQNALLKLLEEPHEGTIIVLCVPHIALLLPTVRSRLLPLPVKQNLITYKERQPTLSKESIEFLHAPVQKRSDYIKKLVAGNDEDQRRVGRDAALRLINDIEYVVYSMYQKETNPLNKKDFAATLSDIETLRGYLYDRAAPVRLILEHVSLIVPVQLGQ